MLPVTQVDHNMPLASFHPPANRKSKILCFQEVKKETSDMKRVKTNSDNTNNISDVFWTTGPAFIWLKLGPLASG